MGGREGVGEEEERGRREIGGVCGGGGERERGSSRNMNDKLVSP